LTISKTKLFLYFIIIPYIKPYNISLNVTLDTFFKIWKVIATLILIFMFIFKKNNISKRVLLGILFGGIWGISIYLNCNNLGNRLQELLSIIGIIILADIIVLSDNNSKEFFSVLYNISTIYILLHLVTVLIQRPLFGTPVNDYDIYFLGGDNHSAFILIPLCGFLYANDFKIYNKIRLKTLFLSLCGWFCLIYNFTVAGMIAYGIFLVLIWVNKNSVLNKIMTIKGIVFILIIFLVGVIFFDIQNRLVNLLQILGKSGLSSREIIWKDAFNVFINNFLIGIGTLTTQQINSYILYGAGHAHNIILELLMDTGIIGTTIFCLWIKENLSNATKNMPKETLCLVKCLVAYLCCALFDFYIGLIYFYLLVVVIFISRSTAQNYRKGD